MDKKKVIEKLKEYVNLINSKFVLDMVILYGSYAKGNWKEESDIDIAVVVDKLRRKIDDRIEPLLLEKNEDKSGFLEDILKYGEIIYQK